MIILLKLMTQQHLYKMTKEHLGWKSGDPPQAFQLDGAKISSPKQMADIQMDYFNCKIEKLIQDIPPKTEDPVQILRDRMQNWDIPPGQREKLSFQPITPVQTLLMINKMGNSTAFGSDELDAQSIKLAAASLYIPITFLLNLSIQQATFATS